MLKKLCFFILCLHIMIFSATVSAHSIGDIIGNVYSTDIVAYVDDVPINSYNIGGRTVVALEDLRNYGFEIDWQAENRRLIVKFSDRVSFTPNIKKLTYNQQGEIIGNVYFSDIQVNLYDIDYAFDTYNIGGITCVAIEDIAISNTSSSGELLYSRYAMHYNWNSKKREIRLYALHKGDSISTPYGIGQITNISPYYDSNMFSLSPENANDDYLMFGISENNKRTDFIFPNNIPKSWDIDVSYDGILTIISKSTKDMISYRYGTYGHPRQRNHLVLCVNIPVTINDKQIIFEETNCAILLPSTEENEILLSTGFIQKCTNRNLSIQ